MSTNELSIIGGYKVFIYHGFVIFHFKISKQFIKKNCPGKLKFVWTIRMFSTQCLSSQASLDTAVDSLSSFLLGTAVQAVSPGLGATNPQVPRKCGARNWKHRKRPSVSKPKWFDKDCETLQRQIRVTSCLLKMQSSNPYLKGKIFTESKEYKILR